ncbi:DUF4062 domain-containing protein [Rhizobium leguminosarum]|uniref:DUF4062 domain-containing protein n=1 Tax=Rhizobium leguminosarum TaxID=384 RepID=UPI001C98074E|nr:DUF4062 domain-containing protein [Rhizobium leguminosarum]MBY5786093.1 DUF4062 domain-containing protein [Rhizobium leguminosarum]
MKIFISSLITGLEPLRTAAREAVTQLGHEAVMAEDFGAQPNSPQVACLQGLRSSGLVVLILGAGYGAKQSSGISPTHEEYREAKDRRPVIAFVQEGVTRDADQEAFVREVQAWDTGLFRDGFTSPGQLKALITRRLHEWEVANAAGAVDERDLLQRAMGMMPEDERGYSRHGHEIALAVSAGPRQPILRPSVLEDETFQEELLQASLFGPNKLFSSSQPTVAGIDNHALVISHADGRGRIKLDGEGNLLLVLPLTESGNGMVILEENVTERMTASLRYAAWLLDRIDQTQRLTHVALAAILTGGEHLVWRTQAEQNASPNSYSMGSMRGEHKPVHLAPGHRSRPAIKHQADQLVEDLVTLLRREWRGR